MGRKKRTGGDAPEMPEGDAGAGAAPAADSGSSAAASTAPAGVAVPVLPGVAAGVNPVAAAVSPAAASLTAVQAMLRQNPNIAAQVAANPLLAGQLLRHVHAVTSAPVVAPVNIDVQELADHFGLDERITKRLDDEMKNRQETFEGDIAALWDILETARSPAGLLSVKIKEMQDGTFIGAPKLDKEIKEFQRKFRLDDQATRKLAEVRVMRAATWKDDIELIHKHLETSNKPSARIMMMLGKLRSGEPIGEPDPRVAPGSWADRKEQEKERAKRDKKSRSRDRGRARSRSRDRRKSRSRDRDRRR